MSAEPAALFLFETFALPGQGPVRRWALHMDRLRSGAARLGIPIDPNRIVEAVDTARGAQTVRARLVLSPAGDVSVETNPMPDPVAEWTAAFATTQLRADDPWLQVKSSRRTLYDTARADLPQGVDEWLFLNERGEVCEGTITNLLVDLGAGWVTPPLSSGVLPGVMRQSLINSGQVHEQTLFPDDLKRARRLCATNALREMIPLRLGA